MTQISIQDSDKVRQIILTFTFVFSLMLTVVLPFVTDISFMHSSLFMVLPFIVIAIWDMLFGDRWFQLAASLIIPGVMFLVGWRWAFIASVFTLGMPGVMVFSEMFQRYVLAKELDKIEHRTSSENNFKMRLISVMFGIADGMDTRSITMKGSFRRCDISKTDLLMASIPAIFVLSLIFIQAVAVHPPVTFDLMVTFIMATLYASAFAVPGFIICLLDVRIDVLGKRTRLYDMFNTTMVGMTVVVFVALMIVVIASGLGISMFLLVIGVMLLGILMTAATCVMGMTLKGDAVVESIYGRWAKDHPVGLTSGLSGGTDVPLLDDGVPGTPRRSRESCYPHMKN